MRFKYYLRGIGIGITLATLILTISFYFGKGTLTKEHLSDEEIIERATSLGMIMPEEEVSISDEVVAKSALEDEVADTTLESEETDVNENVEENTKESESSDEYTLEQALSDASDDTKSADTTVTYVPFRIKGGESSETICKNLKKAGLVDSERDFNKYLNKLDLDNAISTGNFYIPTGSSYDDIVALLANKEIRTTTLPETPKPEEAPKKPVTPKAGE